MHIGEGLKNRKFYVKKMPHKEKYLQDHISYSLVNGTEILAWARKSEIMYFRAKTVSSLTTDLFALPPHKK